MKQQRKKYIVWIPDQDDKCGKEGHPVLHFIENNMKDRKKNSIKEVITTIPDLVDPLNQERLILAG